MVKLHGYSDDSIFHLRFCMCDAFVAYFEYFLPVILCRKYCVLVGKQKIHYTLTDGSEMVEEYDMRSYDLLGIVIVRNIMRYCDHFTYFLHICCLCQL